MFPSEVSLVVSILSKTEGKKKASFFGSEYEKYLFVTMVSIFCLMMVAGTIFFFFRNSTIEITVITLTLLFYLAAMTWQISLIVPIFTFFKNPTAQLLQVFESGAIKEISSMNSFEDISLETVEYLSNRLLLAKEQLHRRMAYLMGAVDKVGILPGLVASFLALNKILESKVLPVEDKQLYIYAAIAFCFLYAFSISAMLICQRFEVYAGILKHHLKCRTDIDP